MDGYEPIDYMQCLNNLPSLFKNFENLEECILYLGELVLDPEHHHLYVSVTF